VPAGARTGVPAVAARIAAAHLRALGCEVAEAGAALDCQAGPLRARCELSWSGPLLLDLASEADVQAACGLTHVHGRRYGRPTPLGVAYASTLAGALAATGTLAALLADGDGCGCGDGCGDRGRPEPRVVTTSVAQAALLSIGQYLAAATAEADRAEDAAAPAERLQPGAEGGPPFLSADGVRFELETLDPECWLRFWAALGADRRTAGRGWLPFQQRYATAVCPLPPELHRLTRQFAFAELQVPAAEAGVDLTHVAARPHAVPEDADGVPWRIRPVAGHRVVERSAAGRRGAPLAGVTVVEVARRVQGPLAGHLLRLLGARVVRIEPVGGDPMRGLPPMAGDCSARFTALNHGKETLEADLADPAGRAAVRELAAGADVFLHALAPGKDRSLGLDAAALTAEHPGLVHVSASGWGEDRGARPPIGTDFPVQAWSGLAALVTPPGLPAAPSLFTLTDVLGGVVCAEGAVAGLLAARLTGRGQAVTSSLLSAAWLLCRPEVRQPVDGAAPGVPDCTDLARLAADPRFAPALEHGTHGTHAPHGLCTLVRSPWGFPR